MGVLYYHYFILFYFTVNITLYLACKDSTAILSSIFAVIANSEQYRAAICYGELT
jgi:hypothetical protein